MRALSTQRQPLILGWGKERSLVGKQKLEVPSGELVTTFWFKTC